MDSLTTLFAGRLHIAQNSFQSYGTSYSDITHDTAHTHAHAPMHTRTICTTHTLEHHEEEAVPPYEEAIPLPLPLPLPLPSQESPHSVRDRMFDIDDDDMTTVCVYDFGYESEMDTAETSLEEINQQQQTIPCDSCNEKLNEFTINIYADKYFCKHCYRSIMSKFIK